MAMLQKLQSHPRLFPVRWLWSRHILISPGFLPQISHTVSGGTTTVFFFLRVPSLHLWNILLWLAEQSLHHDFLLPFPRGL